MGTGIDALIHEPPLQAQVVPSPLVENANVLAIGTGSMMTAFLSTKQARVAVQAQGQLCESIPATFGATLFQHLVEIPCCVQSARERDHDLRILEAHLTPRNLHGF